MTPVPHPPALMHGRLRRCPTRPGSGRQTAQRHEHLHCSPPTLEGAHSGPVNRGTGKAPSRSAVDGRCAHYAPVKRRCHQPLRAGLRDHLPRPAARRGQFRAGSSGARGRAAHIRGRATSRLLAARRARPAGSIAVSLVAAGIVRSRAAYGCGSCRRPPSQGAAPAPRRGSCGSSAPRSHASADSKSEPLPLCARPASSPRLARRISVAAPPAAAPAPAPPASAPLVAFVVAERCRRLLADPGNILGCIGVGLVGAPLLGRPAHGRPLAFVGLAVGRKPGLLAPCRAVRRDPRRAPAPATPPAAVVRRRRLRSRPRRLERAELRPLRAAPPRRLVVLALRSPTPC